MEEVTLPAPPAGYEYILITKSFIRNKDPSELTPRQLTLLKYREKNKKKLNELSCIKYHENKYQKEKESNLSKEEPPDITS